MSGTQQAIPADDPARALTLVHPDDESLSHLAVVGDTYTILVRGADTAAPKYRIELL